MLMEWLEPAIERRIEEAVDFSENNSIFIEVNKQFKLAFQTLNLEIPEDFRDTLFSMESLKNDLLRICIEKSYRFGFNDGAKINKDSRNIKL